MVTAVTWCATTTCRPLSLAALPRSAPRCGGSIAARPRHWSRTARRQRLARPRPRPVALRARRLRRRRRRRHGLMQTESLLLTSGVVAVLKEAVGRRGPTPDHEDPTIPAAERARPFATRSFQSGRRAPTAVASAMLRASVYGALHPDDDARQLDARLPKLARGGRRRQLPPLRGGHALPLRQSRPARWSARPSELGGAGPPRRSLRGRGDRRAAVPAPGLAPLRSGSRDGRARRRPDRDHGRKREHGRPRGRRPAAPRTAPGTARSASAADRHRREPRQPGSRARRRARRRRPRPGAAPSAARCPPPRSP